MDDDTANRLQSHFWITGTALAVNGVLMSDAVENSPRWAVLVSAIFVWFLATYNIVEIAGPYIKRPVVNTKRTPSGHYWPKWWETLGDMRVFYKRVWFALVEFKGALLYIVLVFGSLVGVFLFRDVQYAVVTPLGCLVAAIVASWLLNISARFWW